MIELPDDYTDKLFQEGAEQFDFTYNPQAWEGMEQMLNEDERRRRVWSIFFYGFLGLVLVGGLYVLSTYLNSSAVELAQESIAPNDVILDEPSGKLIPADRFQYDQAASAPESDSGIDRVSVDALIEQDQVMPVLESAANSSEGQGQTAPRSLPQLKPSTPAILESQQALSVGNSTVIAAVNELRPNSIRGLDQEALVTHTAKNSPSISLESSDDSLFAELKVEAPKEQVKIAEIASIDLQKLETAVITSEEEFLVPKVSRPQTVLNQSRPLLSRISVRAHGGVIYGITGQSSVGMARARYGAGFGYAVNDRLTLGSGVSVNNLCYITDGDGYKTKGMGWFGGASPSRVEAQCKVLEIPLEVTYHWRGSRQDGLFFRGGMLNYLMLQEEYGFSYVDSEIPPGVDLLTLRTGWEESNTNQHFLGIAQLALGYQFALSPKSQLQVEGYIHTPLSGIGHGDVKVWTFGVNTSINLNLK